MPTSEHYLETRHTARYYLIGKTGSHVSTIFFALHGYGFLARYFARRFENVDRSDILFVFPEGFHKYYLDSEHKRVGASWMTREDRLTDISDQLFYLDRLYQEIALECPNTTRSIALGFSQGTATAARWVAKSQYKINDLILWGGALPPDLTQEEIDRISDMDLFTALGDNDEYIDQERFEQESNRLSGLGLQQRVLRFTGGHDIPSEGLEKLISILSL